MVRELVDLAQDVVRVLVLALAVGRVELGQLVADDHLDELVALVEPRHEHHRALVVAARRRAVRAAGVGVARLLAAHRLDLVRAVAELRHRALRECAAR